MNDREIMEKIRQLMTPNKKLYEYRHPNSRGLTYSIVSTNPDDIEFLQNLGITARKSLTVKFPDIPEDLLPHFIRGLFDGDGSIYKMNTINGKDYYGVSFTTGSLQFATELQKILNDKVVERASLIQDSRSKNGDRNSTWYIRLGRQNDIRKFFDYIYRDTNDMYLHRKHCKFPMMI